MRCLLLMMIAIPTLLVAQVRNVHQAIEKGRIVVTYDLVGNAGSHYDLRLLATDERGRTFRPEAVVGELTEVRAGNSRSIWWEPKLEGLPLQGWILSLAATQSTFGIKWTLVDGGPRGDFYISTTEVTFEQYDTFCEATGHQKPKADFGGGKQPVINVNIADAVGFCDWLSKETGKRVRLPEEDEWEFAANGGRKGHGYQYSGSTRIDEVAWHDDNSGNAAHEVATKKPNELGLYDMTGNVWEWGGTNGAVRGGSWSNFRNRCLIEYRDEFDPTLRDDNLGFRVIQMP